MDDKDKEILNLIQWDFPLTKQPFKEIGRRLGIDEEEALRRIRRIKEEGLIRQINAIFDTRKLGYKSALVAMSIEPNKLEEVAYEINKHPGVSHNYERDHEYNLWFTIAVPPDGNIKHDLEEFAKLDGVKKYRILPTIKLYKIGVKLDMLDNDDKPKAVDKPTIKDLKPIKLTERDKEFIRELQKDIELVKEPFNEPAKRLGITVEELLAKAKEYEKIGIMRRFAAILRHRDAGFTANGMIVWKVPEDRIDEIGYRVAAYKEVSHCYKRPTYEDWPYNLFSMVHARSKESCIKIAEEIAKDIKIDDYRILFSLREFKKERVKYYVTN
ncbi:MAG: Lrp/AsnC family transcriptional regulator [Candidatus Nitrosothermus koennekii]|nr:MAG: Lrp/AsnC family transcriptional regulator [Candidatus Nitrosothermus koennekii]